MRLIIIAFFTFPMIACYAQTFNYRNYTVENGLASPNVYAAIQDRNGFMWFATDNGINRFDGNTFEHFTLEDGLSDNDVFRIFEDSYGRIWFLTSNGHLSYYKDGKFHNEKSDSFLTQANSTPGYHIAFEDSRKRIWFCSMNCQITILNGKDVTKILIPCLNSDRGVSVYEDGSKNINALIEDHKYIFNEEKQLFALAAASPTAFYCSNFYSPYGQLYFISLDKVYKVNKGSISIVYDFQNTNLICSDVLTATNGKDSSDYICTKNGVVCFNPRSSEIKYFMTGKWINSVTVDNEGNIWFMTRGNGVYLLPKQYGKERIYNNLSLSNEDIYSLAVGINGAIWIGCANNTTSVFENDSIKNIFPKIRNRTGKISNMAADKAGNIWCCSDIGFYKINGKDRTIKLPPEFETIRTLNTTFNSKGTCIAAMHYAVATITENKNHLIINRFSDTFLIKRPYCVFYDMADHLYITNVNGLYDMIDNKIIYRAEVDPLLKTKIISISQASDSSIVLGTEGYGVVFYKNGKVTLHVSSKQGLTSSVCKRIRIYDDKVFVCTNKGLTQFTYRNGEAKDFRIYEAPYGLPSGDVRDVLIDKGLMYVATSKGLAILEENSPLRTVSPPGIYIKDVLNNVNHVNFKSPFSVPFRNNTLTIKYSAITFTNQDDIIYEYSIHENSSELKQTALSELTFPDISPGNYTFAIRAKKKNSDWSALTTFPFNVEYPYYQRWWFYMLIIFTFVGGLMLVFIYFHRRSLRMQLVTLEKRNALNFERNRISEDMHDDLGADLSRIVVISELIKFDSSKDHPLQSNIAKISEYATGATKKMDDIIWALNPQNDTLQSLISHINQYCLNYFEGSGIKVEIATDDMIIDLPINAKQRRNIFLVIKEIANNALKYSNAGIFLINFKIKNNILHIIVGDSGIGFQGNGINEFGNGLKNISKRISELHGSVVRRSDHLEGTWYEISIPVNVIT